MKTYLYILLILLSFYTTSCDQQPNPEIILKKTTVSIPEKYNISDFKSDWAIGESTEDYKLLISKEDYQKIVKEIEAKKFFQQLDSAKTPIYAFDGHTNSNKIIETACWYNNRYFYQIFRPNPGIVITIVLEKDSLMMISYNNL